MKQQASALKPLYLIVGEDELKRETALKKLRARFEQAGEALFNTDTFSGDSISGSDVVAACNTLPFCAQQRLVVVTSVEKMGKPDAEELIAYLKKPAETTVLALVAEKLAANTRLYKAIAKCEEGHIIDCAPKKRSQLPGMIKRMAQGYGISMKDEAALALLEALGENTVALDGELKRISLSVPDGKVLTAQDISRFVTRRAQASIWEFLDAFAARKLKESLQLLERLDSSSPYALIGQCTARIRELICAKALTSRGQAHRIAAELGKQDWQVRARAGQARNYTMQELTHALISATEVELAMKSGANPDLAFRDWLIDVCKPRG